MEDALIEEKISPAGYRIRVELSTYDYSILTPGGQMEASRGTVRVGERRRVPRVVFLGSEFNLSHFYLGELVFVNAKEGKMIVPYQFGSSTDLKIVQIPSFSDSDVMPIILYHYSHYKDIIKANDMGYVFKYIVVDETLPKGDMVNLKVRYPNVNILIQKRKVPNSGS